MFIQFQGSAQETLGEDGKPGGVGGCFEEGDGVQRNDSSEKHVGKSWSNRDSRRIKTDF